MGRALMRPAAAFAVVVILATGCETMQSNPKTTVGAVGGATVGGLIAGAAGGNAAAVAAGVIGGGLVGGLIGNLLDERDRRLQAEAAYQAFERTRTGKSVAWRNPDSGHSGTVKPVRTYKTAGGTNCREYETTVTIEGRQERARGTACRQADGTWRLVSS